MNDTQIKTLGDLWAQTVDIWKHGFMGVDISNIIIALAILLGFLLVRGLFSRYVLTRIYAFAMRSDTHLDNRIVEALIPPIKFIPVILGIFFAARYAGLDDMLGDFFVRFVRTLIAFTIFWGLNRVIDPLSYILHSLQKLLTPLMARWLFKVLRVLTIFIGGAVILEIWGIQVGPLLAGLGLFGAAVALGAQDLFKNLIGGMTIIAEKRFHPDDWIKVDGIVEGVVEDIGFRSTKIRRFDKAPVHVPNAQLSDAAVTNYTRVTHRRIHWMIGVEYRTTEKQLRIVRDNIEKYVTDHPDIFDPNVTHTIRVDSFGASSIDILINVFTLTTNWAEYMEIKETFAFEVKQIVEEKAKTGFAFPSQSVYVESLPEDKPEPFAPGAEKPAKEKSSKTAKK